MANIILVHGMWSHGDVAAPLRESLERRGHTVLSPTLPGHGGPSSSSSGQVGTVSIATYVDAICEFIEGSDLETPPFLIGHSMGGLIAQMVASRTPVAGLGLLNSAAPAGSNHIYPRPAWFFRRTLATPGFWNRAQKPSFANAMTGLFHRIDPGKAKEIYDTLVEESGRAFFELVFWWIDRKRTTRIGETLSQIPVFILSSGDDRVVHPSVAKSLLKRYPHADFQLFPENGHWVFHEEGEEAFYEALSLWISAIISDEKDAREESHHLPREFPQESGSQSIRGASTEALPRFRGKPGNSPGKALHSSPEGRNTVLPR